MSRRLTKADRERIRAEVKELAKRPRGEITFGESAVGFSPRNGPAPMTRDEHRERHKLLHVHFDELLADYLQHWYKEHPIGNIGPEADPEAVKGMSNTTAEELAAWSNRQQKEPDEL